MRCTPPFGRSTAERVGLRRPSGSSSIRRATGAEEREGLPYVSRSALKDKLAADGRKARTIENDLSAAYPDKLIGALVLSEIISPIEHGWVVCDEVQASAMLMRKGGEK